MDVPIDADRFRESFETYSRFGATDNEGLHRLALTDEDREARDQFVRDLEAAGLEISVDDVGNIFGRRAGEQSGAAPVLIGSHLDSQPYGGRYDGQLGVLTALETIRALNDHNVKTERPVEIVNWTNEEGSRFQPAMMGSAAFIDKISVEESHRARDREGRTVSGELERIGYRGEEPCGDRDVHCFLELHIEQGAQLEDMGLSLGVVEGVFGLVWLRVTISGEANHAGPTPMHLRKDAMATAADAISRIETLPNRLSGDAVATVGECSVTPNSINVIPSQVDFSVDIRSYDEDTIRTGVTRVEEEIGAACKRHGTSFEMQEVAWNEPIEFSPRVRETIRQVAGELNQPCVDIVSGAGHDAQHMNAVTDTGMIFVPSVDGITHAEAEYTEWEDCVKGARLFAATTAELARM